MLSYRTSRKIYIIHAQWRRFICLQTFSEPQTSQVSGGVAYFTVTDVIRKQRFFCLSCLPTNSPPAVSLFQGTTIARQIGAVAYVECTSKVSENSVRDVFHVTTVASVRRPLKPQLKRSSSRRGLKRVSQLPLPPLPGRTEQMDQAPAMRKGRAKSCVLM